jgi:hypothetical protein
MRPVLAEYGYETSPMCVSAFATRALHLKDEKVIR